MRPATFVFISLITLNLCAEPIEAPAPGQRKKHTIRNYGKSFLKRDTLVMIGGSAAIGQIRNSPHEWGGGALGYAKRFGSGVAHYAVRDGIQRGIGAVLHEEQNTYVRANKPGFGPKFKSAAENTFWVKHRNSNKRDPAVGRLSGDFGSGMISRLWMPARLHTISSGLATGGISLGADFGWNLAREYMPEHRGHK
jgi:hypothetical protein